MRLMAYRAVDHYVYERVRSFLRRRHKVSSSGYTIFSDAVVFDQAIGCEERVQIPWRGRTQHTLFLP
jgi:hypothetical protein